MILSCHSAITVISLSVTASTKKHQKLCNITAKWRCKDESQQLRCFEDWLLQLPFSWLSSLPAWSTASCHEHCCNCTTYFWHWKVWPHPVRPSSLAAGPEMHPAYVVAVCVQGVKGLAPPYLEQLLTCVNRGLHTITLNSVPSESWLTRTVQPSNSWLV